VAEFLPGAPMMRNQVALMRRDNVVSGGLPGLQDLRVGPTAVEDACPRSRAGADGRNDGRGVAPMSAGPVEHRVPQGPGAHCCLRLSRGGASMVGLIRGTQTGSMA